MSDMFQAEQEAIAKIESLARRSGYCYAIADMARAIRLLMVGRNKITRDELVETLDGLTDKVDDVESRA